MDDGYVKQHNENNFGKRWSKGIGVQYFNDNKRIEFKYLSSNSVNS